MPVLGVQNGFLVPGSSLILLLGVYETTLHPYFSPKLVLVCSLVVTGFVFLLIFFDPHNIPIKNMRKKYIYIMRK